MNKIKLYAIALGLSLLTLGACGDKTNRAENSSGTEDPNGRPDMEGVASDTSRYPASGENGDTTGSGSSRSVHDTPGAPGSAYGSGVEAEDRPAGSPAGTESNQQDRTR